LKNRVIRYLMVPLCTIMCILIPGTAFASVPAPSSVNTIVPAVTYPETMWLNQYSHGKPGRTVTVEKGNTLSGLSETLYGISYDWKILFQANRNIVQNYNLLKIGWILSVPNVRQEPKPVAEVIAAPVTSIIARPVTPPVQVPSVSDETTDTTVLNGSWQSIVSSLLPGPQAGCLDWIIDHESGGNVHAENPKSGAYGIPQALPGDKMASAGPDWQNSAYTQIRWMVGYVAHYGGPCDAQAFWENHGWY
jgi:hypothetical protein